jgi:hypothetical protein
LIGCRDADKIYGQSRLYAFMEMARKMVALMATFG